MIEYLPFPSPTFDPLAISGQVLGITPGTRAKILTLPANNGAKRLRLTHFAINMVASDAIPIHQIDTDIEGLSDFNGLIPVDISNSYIQIALYHTLRGNAEGGIFITNNDGVNRDCSISLLGFYDYNDKNNYPVDWLPYLIPNKKSKFLALTFNTANPVKLGFNGRKFRVYAVSASITGAEGDGIQFLNGYTHAVAVGNMIPVFAILKSGSVYRFVNTAGAAVNVTLYGWTIP